MTLTIFTLGAVPYFTPTGIAAYRDHADGKAIFLVNLLLGWTVIGWIGAFVWALSGPRGRQDIAAAGDVKGPGGLKLQGRDPRFDGSGNPEP